MEQNLRIFLRKRKARFIGRILHDYDKGVKPEEFKELFKAETNRLINEIEDLLTALHIDDIYQFNVEAEDRLKEVEKAAYSNKDKH